jgi:protein SCO1/2
MSISRHFRWFVLFISMLGCGQKVQEEARFIAPHLPYMGPHDVQRVAQEDGSFRYDTVYHTIPAFSFTDHNGQDFTQEHLKGKVYLADFFFTSCPTICPKMTNTMRLVQEGLKGESNFHLVSHSIDPEFDSPEVLRAYAAKKEADLRNWTFLTGDLLDIYDICEFGYMAFAKPDPNEPGGIIHSGFLILVDQNHHIRGAYDGTRTELAPTIVKDVQSLLHP